MNDKQLNTELHTIRTLMERSAKFMSLSGLSGVLAGVYALVGAGLAYLIMYGMRFKFLNHDHIISENGLMLQLAAIATIVLITALATAFLLSVRKARKQGDKVWSPASKGLLKAIAIPLFAGGFLILILLFHGAYSFIASTCLIFYGLALVAGSRYTYRMVEWLGILQVLLGLWAAAMPGFSLFLWTLGFGLLHIVYGSIMHIKYDRRGGDAKGV